MKKLVFAVCSFALLGATYATTQLDVAVTWMYQNWLTKYDNSTDFMSEKSLRRDEAAKFFVQYAKQQLHKSPDTSKKECDGFSDLNKWYIDLQDNVKDACRLWLFKGSQGKFMPEQTLTNGQAITVLMRMIDGMQDETKWHFATQYFQKAVSLDITEWVSLSENTFDAQATRWDVGILLYNASHMENITSTPVHQKEDQRFVQCKKVSWLPLDYSTFTGSFSWQFEYINVLIPWVNNDIISTNENTECNATNQYLRQELFNLRLLRKKIITRT